MVVVYPALLVKDEAGEYLVCVPDLHIYTEGTSLSDAIAMARDAIGTMCVCLEDDGKSLPEASTLERAVELTKEDEDGRVYAAGIATYVDCDVTKWREKIG